ncbi:DNA-binding protein [Thermoleptolyngbya sichuanensis A183]|uniref:DNA-binding protein n=2 Tax=Oculatellaceae TaxID=2303507 RepID=A0A6M8BR82_9CYAN|nr:MULTISPECIES: DNA-binding protein [Thermoleptolyngbya]QKD84735.1 DNA-binding protein [Thermoleptolyngbya sichuanensis A183]
MKHLFLKLAPVLVVGASLVSISPQVTAQSVPIGNLRRHQGITITGTVQSIVGNEFLLRDNTGEIIVDAGPRWYHQINLSPGERVTVVGEYDDYDFDAFRITRENGEVIVIRNGPGRPPWAGGPRGAGRPYRGRGDRAW